MKMISSARNNGREQTKIGSINIRVVPPAPQRFFCQRPMVMSVTVGRLNRQADEVPVWGFSLPSLPMTGDGSKDIFPMLASTSAPDQIAWVESVMVAATAPGSTATTTTTTATTAHAGPLLAAFYCCTLQRPCWILEGSHHSLHWPMRVGDAWVTCGRWRGRSHQKVLESATQQGHGEHGGLGMTEAPLDSLSIHMIACSPSGMWSWRLINLQIWHTVMQMMLTRMLTEERNQRK